MQRNIAVIGRGYWGKNLVHTICDIVTGLIEKDRAQYPQAIILCSDYRRVLQDDAVKGVVIAAPAIEAPCRSSPVQRALAA